MSSLARAAMGPARSVHCTPIRPALSLNRASLLERETCAGGREPRACRVICDARARSDQQIYLWLFATHILERTDLPSYGLFNVAVAYSRHHPASGIGANGFSAEADPGQRCVVAHTGKVFYTAARIRTTEVLAGCAIHRDVADDFRKPLFRPHFGQPYAWPEFGF